MKAVSHIACDKLILAGATLARRIGSSSYRHWIDAMIKLNRLDEDEDYKAVDDIVAALVQLWADQSPPIRPDEPFFFAGKWIVNGGSPSTASPKI